MAEEIIGEETVNSSSTVEGVADNTTNNGSIVINGVALENYSANGKYSGDSLNFNTSVLESVSTEVIKGYNNSDIFMYIPEGCDKDNAKIVYMAPGAGGGINYQTQGELFDYMCKSNDPNTIYVYGNYCNKAEGPAQNFNIALDYLQNNGYVSSVDSLVYDSYSEGTCTAINTAISAAKMTDSSGNALCENITVIVGSTGSGYISSKPTVEDCKALADVDANVIFYCHTGTGGDSDSMNYSTSLIKAPIVKNLVAAGVNTYMIDINWEQVEADYGGTSYSPYAKNGDHLLTHGQLSPIFHEFIFPTLMGDSSEIELTDNTYFAIKIPKDLDGDGKLELYDATEEELQKLYPSLYQQYLSEGRQEIQDAENYINESSDSEDGTVTINKIDASEFFSDISNLSQLEKNSSYTSSNYNYTMDSMNSIRSMISASANECSQASVIAGRFSSGILAQIGAYVNKFYSSYGNLLSSLSSETDSVASLATAIEDMDHDLENKQGTILETDNSYIKSTDSKYTHEDEVIEVVTNPTTETATETPVTDNSSNGSGGSTYSGGSSNGSGGSSYNGSGSSYNDSGNTDNSSTVNEETSDSSRTEVESNENSESDQTTESVEYTKEIVDDSTLTYTMDDGAKITINHDGDTITNMECEYTFESNDIAVQNYNSVLSTYSNSPEIDSITVNENKLLIKYSESFISNYNINNIENIFKE